MMHTHRAACLIVAASLFICWGASAGPTPGMDHPDVMDVSVRLVARGNKELDSSPYFGVCLSARSYKNERGTSRTQVYNAVAHMSPEQIRGHVYCKDGELVWAYHITRDRITEYAPTRSIDGSEPARNVLVQYDGMRLEYPEISWPLFFDHGDGCTLGVLMRPWNAHLPDKRVSMFMAEYIIQNSHLIEIEDDAGIECVSAYSTRTIQRERPYVSTTYLNNVCVSTSTGWVQKRVSYRADADVHNELQVREFSGHSTTPPDNFRWQLKASDFTEENMKTDPMFALDREYLASLKESPTPLDDPAGIIAQLIQKLGITEEVVGVDPVDTPELDEAIDGKQQRPGAPPPKDHSQNTQTDEQTATTRP